MAAVPSTIIIFSDDKVNFPPKDVYIFMKHLFQYGVKNISLIQDKVFVHLTYSPRAETLKKKFQQLPLKYMRTKVDDISEFKVLERAVKKFKYNLVSDELEVPQIKYVDQQQQRSQYLAEIDAVPSTSSEVGSLDVEQNNVLDLEDGEEEEMIKEFLSNVNKNDK